MLNAPERVSPDTAERVRQAIAELDYRPHWMARRLRTRTSRTLGIAIRPTEQATAGNLIDRFMHSLTSHAWRAGYRVLLFTQPTGEDELATYQELSATGTVDGFVLYDLRIDDDRPGWLSRRGIPFACFGRPPDAPGSDGYSWVDVDGAAGIEQGVDHLVRLGHRRVGFIGWRQGGRWWTDREQGWRAAMRRHALDIAGLFAAAADDEPIAGRDAARGLLASGDPPTAFVCASDTLAAGARLAAGIAVDIVGFDDSPVAALLQPPLSSVRQPLEDVAQAIVRLLVDQLDGRTATEGVLLPPQLIVRDRYPA